MKKVTNENDNMFFICYINTGTSKYQKFFLYHVYMDFNTTKQTEALWKYLPNDVYNRFVAHIINEILTENQCLLLNFVTLIMQSN